METAPVAVKRISMTRTTELLIGRLEKSHRVRGMGTMTLHTGTITGEHMGMGGQHLLPDPGMAVQT